MLPERLVGLAAERDGKQRVVADLGMGVERQVVRGQVHVVGEQRAQALGQCARQPGWVEVPEQAVVHEHEIGAQGERALDQLAVRRDAGDDSRDVGPPGNLEPVGPVVAERTGLQQLVEVRDQIIDVCHVRLETRDSGQLNVDVLTRASWARELGPVGELALKRQGNQGAR